MVNDDGIMYKHEQHAIRARCRKLAFLEFNAPDELETRNHPSANAGRHSLRQQDTSSGNEG